MKTKKSLLVSSAVLATVLIGSVSSIHGVDSHVKADISTTQSTLNGASREAQGSGLIGEDGFYMYTIQDGVLTVGPTSEQQPTWFTEVVGNLGLANRLGLSDELCAKVTSVVFSSKNPINGAQFSKIKLDGSMAYMFSGFPNLNSVDFSGAQNGVDDSNQLHYITNMHHAFAGTKISKVTGTTDVSFDKVTDLSDLFRDVQSTTIDVGFLGSLPAATDLGGMFSGADKLTSLDVSKFDTSNVTSMNQMFANTASLTSLDLSKFNTQNVTKMADMFYGSSKLTSLDVSKFNTSKVTDMSYMFSGLKALTGLNLGSFSTQNVTDMSEMFYGSSKLTNLDVSKFNTSKVTDMPSMFSGTNSLSSLDVSNWDTSKVTDMSGLFKGTSSLKSLDLTNLNTSAVTNMSSMFTSTGVESLDLSNFNTTKVTDMSNMFDGAKNMTSLDLASFDTTNTIKMGQMFNNLGKLSKLNLSSFTINGNVDTSSLFAGTPIRELTLGARSRLSSNVKLHNPSTSGFTGKWQTLGTGTAAKPEGSWVGTTDELISRSATGAIDTYVWQPAQHNYVFTAKDISVKQSEVAKLDIVKASGANVSDTFHPDDKFTVEVKDNGGLTNKVGTYKVTLVAKDLQDVSKTITVNVVADSKPTPPAPGVKYQAVYRLYNKNTGEHFYTESSFERDSLVKGGWNNEGTGWSAPNKGTAVYRVYNPNVKGGDHYYTASKYEAQSLVKTGWKWDNGAKPVLYSGGKTPVYVAYNPNAKASGSHNYTSSSFEQQSLLKNGWKFGKIQFYGK